MKFYFVGLDLRDGEHDYAPALATLAALHGRKVSRRIWLCVVGPGKGDVLASLQGQLAAADGMLVVEVPPTMRLPETTGRAA